MRRARDPGGAVSSERAEVAVDILDGRGLTAGPGDALVQRVLEWDPLSACVAVSGGCLQKTGSSPPWPQTP